jgi:glycosyltransferase involved in cell wall biosynthesis
VLDSLRHGTPVLCSFNSSLQEFAGPGVFYFDPCDPESLDNACRELLASGPMVVHRPELDERFSWEAMARKVLSLCA